MSQAVIGIVPTNEEAEVIVDCLRAEGFSNQSISALLPAGGTTEELGLEKQNKAPEGAATGGTTGIVLGGALGWLIGVGAIAIPGAGPFIAAGPIMAMLGGAGIGGAVGGIGGTLVGLGIPEIEAKKYESMVHEGNILLAVDVTSGEDAKRVEQIFKDNGLKEICKTGEKKAKDQPEAHARPRGPLVDNPSIDRP